MSVLGSSWNMILINIIVCYTILEYVQGDLPTSLWIYRDKPKVCTHLTDKQCEDPDLQSHPDFTHCCDWTTVTGYYSCSEACKRNPAPYCIGKYCKDFREQCVEQTSSQNEPTNVLEDLASTSKLSSTGLTDSNPQDTEAIDGESDNLSIVTMSTLVSVVWVLGCTFCLPRQIGVLGYIIAVMIKRPRIRGNKLNQTQDNYESINDLVDGKLLGRGAYASVYLHYDSQTGRMLSVKKVMLDPTNHQVNEEVRALKNEISLMKTLNHERIVQYIRAETQSDMLCIYMEYMPGGSLKSKLLQDGSLDEATTKKYTKQILEGLYYLHSQRIIHRDVKGSNILCDGKGGIKLADFGLSKRMDTIQTLTLTKSASTKGTIYWMAPEVIEGKIYGRRADIWSTGATVVEMLTTHPPWHELDPYPAMFKIGTLKKASYSLDPIISSEAEHFLTATFTPEEQRPSAESLLQHSWLK